MVSSRSSRKLLEFVPQFLYLQKEVILDGHTSIEWPVPLLGTILESPDCSWHDTSTKRYREQPLAEHVLHITALLQNTHELLLSDSLHPQWDRSYIYIACKTPHYTWVSPVWICNTVIMNCTTAMSCATLLRLKMFATIFFKSDRPMLHHPCLKIRHLTVSLNWKYCI